MTYETMDWDAEAKRVARAFRADYLSGDYEVCRFIENARIDEPGEHGTLTTQPIYRELGWPNLDSFVASIALPENPLARFSCQYNKRKGMTFSIDVPSHRTKKTSTLTDINIHWRGYIHSRIRDNKHALFLAKGLFNLGLLTPQVESKLKIPITANQKAIWQKEAEGVLACEALDFGAEALRIANAFDLKEKCEFEPTTFGYRKAADLKSNGDYPRFRDNLRFHAYYCYTGRRFYVESEPEDGYKLSLYWTRSKIEDSITLSWDGACLLSNIVDGTPLAQGLFNLGLLTPEVEAALKVTITAHQKLEWALEYEARMSGR